MRDRGDREIQGERDNERARVIPCEREMERQRQREGERERQRQRERETETETERDRQRVIANVLSQLVDTSRMFSYYG